MASNLGQQAGLSPTPASLAVTVVCCIIGVLLHLAFQYFVGSWYDGLVFLFGFSTAAVIFAATFAVSFVASVGIESLFKGLATLTRCLIHLAVGFVFVPVALVMTLLLMAPELTLMRLSIVVAMELFFAVIVWSVTLLTYGIGFELLRRRYSR